MTFCLAALSAQRKVEHLRREILPLKTVQAKAAVLTSQFDSCLARDLAENCKVLLSTFVLFTYIISEQTGLLHKHRLKYTAPESLCFLVVSLSERLV